MINLNATPGASTANSYVTVAEADEYFMSMFGRSLWAQTSDEDKKAALITASRNLDMYFDWFGLKTAQAQSLDWPRVGVLDKSGLVYDFDVIPMAIKIATLELAFYVLSHGGLSFEDSLIDRVKVGSIDVEFSKGTATKGLPGYVVSLVEFLGESTVEGGASMKTVELRRV